MHDPNDTVVLSVTDEYDNPNKARRSVVLPGLTPAEGRRPRDWSRFLAILLRALAAWPA